MQTATRCRNEWPRPCGATALSTGMFEIRRVALLVEQGSDDRRKVAGAYSGGPVKEARGRYKRPMDLFLLTVSHVVFAPLFILFWMLIPLIIRLNDGGPVFYRQRRTGKDGRVFSVLKFRTMVPDAHKRGPAWTLEGDTRLTRAGPFLRKTALDELPQVLSIWKGDMTFVGPRALPVEEQKTLEELIPGFHERLRIRPGLTGLAQVYNPEDDPHIKLSYDLEYMRRMNPLFDAKLLLLSVRNTLLARWDRRGAKTGMGGRV